MLCELLDVFCSGIIGEQIEFAAAVRSEIDFAPDSHGIGVVAASFRLRDYFYMVICDCIEPNC